MRAGGQARPTLKVELRQLPAGLAVRVAEASEGQLGFLATPSPGTGRHAFTRWGGEE